MRFTTRDRDNDVASDRNCADVYMGAWWYSACHLANLNGLYLAGDHATAALGVNWEPYKGHYYSLKTTTMKIKPVI